MLSRMSDAIQERFSELGVHVPRITMPAHGVDLYRWAVIACDQHTSEPDYWEEVSRIVGDSPSTLRLIYPEVFLGHHDFDERIQSIHQYMANYMESNTVEELDPGFVFTVRSTPHVSERRGLMLAIDLDEYEFTPGASTLIRATERTIVERLPARVQIRQGAPLEIPHVLVLIDDPDDLVFGSLNGDDLPQLYSTQLMLGGGNVAGYHIRGEVLDRVADALRSLRDRSDGKHPFLFAVGDGNHSLASAKRVWEEMKATSPPDHPARYALVEVVNLYDPGLRVEPIHRLVMAEDPEGWLARAGDSLGERVDECTHEEIRRELRHGKASIGYLSGKSCGLIRLRNGKDLPVGVLEEYLQQELQQNDSIRVDYIHGWDTSVQLAGRDGTVVLLLPEFDQRLLFPTVSKRGVLPRKAFSLGEAEEKRYYLEARRIM